MNHQAVIDTANGTINFPHVEKTLAMTDYCNPKPLQILVEGNEILLPQQTTANTAIVVTANINDVPAAVQPLPQFDDSASIIVAPALTTAKNKRMNTRMVNMTEFPYSFRNHTKLFPNFQTRRHETDAAYRWCRPKVTARTL